MAYTGPALSLQAKITIAPENIPAFLEALKPAYEGVKAAPECTFFELYHSYKDPGVFRIIENWNATLEWLQTVQLKKDYYKPYFERTEPMYIKSREFEVYERMPASEWVSIDKAFYFP